MKDQTLKVGMLTMLCATCMILCFMAGFKVGYDVRPPEYVGENIGLLFDAAMVQNRGLTELEKRMDKIERK